jgi:hypothetical protein
LQGSEHTYNQTLTIPPAEILGENSLPLPYVIARKTRGATTASLPFFLFTLPAGGPAASTDRRNLLIAVYFWLAASAGLLAGFYLSVLDSPADHPDHGFFSWESGLRLRPGLGVHCSQEQQNRH